jgi:hypothetical protein
MGITSEIFQESGRIGPAAGEHRLRISPAFSKMIPP